MPTPKAQARTWRTSLRCWLFHRRWWNVTLHIAAGKFIRDVRCLWCAGHWMAPVAEVPPATMEQLRAMFPNAQQVGGDA